MKLKSERLSVQVVLLYSLLLGGSMLVFTVHGVYEQVEYRSASLRLQIQAVAGNLAGVSADYILTREYAYIELALLRAIRFPGILDIQVTDKSGRLLGDVVQKTGTDPQPRYGQASLKPPKQGVLTVVVENETLVVWQPILLDDLLGWVRVHYDLGQVSEEITRVWKANLLVGLVILIVTAILFAIFTRRSVVGIQAYTVFADRLTKCKGEQISVVDSSLELHTLGVALNRVSTRLAEQSTAIGVAMTDMERMAAAAEHAPNIIIAIDSQCTVNYMNPYGYQLLSMLEIDDEQLKDILPDNLDALISKAISANTPVRELEVVCNGRSLLWTIAPVYGQKVAHAYGVDVTERKQAEEDARTALIEKISAESANKSKSLFLANMSHELRTPLNAIIGYSEILHEEAIDEGHEAYARDLVKIQGAGKHLLALISEILDLSKIEAGQMRVYVEEMSLDELIDDVLATIEPLLEKNDNRLIVKRGTELGEVRTDITKWQQILLNIVSNATKFTQGGEIIVSIEREMDEHVDWIFFEVKDTGIGMSREQLSRVFEPFTQADNST